MAKKKQINPNQLLFDFDIIEQELFLEGDLHNIKKMLPKLFDTQQEDVMRAEKRFLDGKGYLFTNKTGTGKTYVGLGIAKRFYLNNKKETLIVVPTDKKCLDWIEDGKNLSLNIVQLKDINDKGFEITVTTYANFYQNDAINKRDFDLIIYDESHYLCQNQKGEQTVYLSKHKDVANLPSSALIKAEYLAGKRPDPETCRDNYFEKKKVWEAKKMSIAERLVKKTKVIFLSATPFAYHKSIEYADGVIFEIYEKLIDNEERSYAYNEAFGFEKFMTEHFGYRMKYNKLTIPETGVDQNLLERNFFEKHVELGVMSTRDIDLPFDYSREFKIVDSELSDYIESGMSLFYNSDFKEKYKYLSRFADRKYNYLFVNQLFECLKANKIYKRIQQHLDLNRKVVVFHTYNNATVSHPFHFEPWQLLKNDEEHLYGTVNKEIAMFNNEYSHYVELDLSELINTRAAIKMHFPQAVEFNGTIPKKKRQQYVEEFNKDYSSTNVIIVQTKAGREGISLHDTTGVHQRVMLNLGLPTAPTQAIQEEGRIYRVGLKSNAIYEYIIVQTDTEKIAFGTTIAQRSKTAENLAMGNLARDLETAFKEGYINANNEPPNENQGIGGKEKDRNFQSISEFDKAKTFYWARTKKTSKNKSSEGIDYFATPEPLGYSIVRWLDPQPNDRGLEPEAGHGAIARWFPAFCENKFIEPSYALSSELEINCTGEVLRKRFEDYYIGNKFEFIAMNPPFGIGGKDAAEHLEKALNHLYAYGYSRLIAIVPNGASMDKRLEKLYNSKLFEKFKLVGEIILPTCTFERAGTNVSTRILKIERANQENQFRHSHIDLSYCENINQFFDAIEHLNF